MKIGGRIIQNRNIEANSDSVFSARYKKHYIEVSVHKEVKEVNPEWSIDVWHFDGTYVLQTIIQRCSIREVIIYALDKAGL